MARRGGKRAGLWTGGGAVLLALAYAVLGPEGVSLPGPVAPPDAALETAWNDRGGVLHWTHHDPDGRRPGGWLRHGGNTYR